MTEHQTPTHKVLSIYNKHILPDHLALKCDYEAFCQHSKVEFKFVETECLAELATLARRRGCDTIMYWETRRHQDLFLYISTVPFGPTIKLHVSDIVGSKSMHFHGNFCRKTRAILNFSPEFDVEKNVALRITKELLKRAFSTPYLHHKSAPFLDHMFQFAVVDPQTQQFGFRAYGFDFNDKIKPKTPGEDVILQEAGPGFTMTPVTIYSGCFAGELIWENPNYMTVKDMKEQTKAKVLAKKEKQDADKKWKLGRAEREAAPIDQIDSLFTAAGMQAAFEGYQE